jgi:hypothetical protein
MAKTQRWMERRFEKSKMVETGRVEGGVSLEKFLSYFGKRVI